MNCSFCGKSIQGKYYQDSEGKKICLTCHKNLPQCALCRRFMKEFVNTSRGKICSMCNQKTPRCSICNTLLVETSFHFPGDPRRFCQRCAEKSEKCSLCAKPLSKASFEIPEYGKFCASCMKDAVKDLGTAKTALHSVLQYLSQSLKMQIRSTIGLDLVDGATLGKMRRQNEIGPGTADQNALGLFLREGNKFHVYVKKYLPYPRCLGTLAHEYTHAWQSDHFRPEADILYIEGMAQWVAYHTLLHYGYHEEAKQIPLQPSIYGKGFKAMQALEKRVGFLGVIPRLLSFVGRKK